MKVNLYLIFQMVASYAELLGLGVDRQLEFFGRSPVLEPVPASVGKPTKETD
jgi:hypothetical protein